MFIVSYASNIQLFLIDLFEMSSSNKFNVDHVRFELSWNSQLSCHEKIVQLQGLECTKKQM